MIIEELRELLKMLQGVPDMALHALVGFGIYKLIIFLGTSAGIYGTLRLAINKLYDYKVYKQNVSCDLNLDSILIGVHAKRRLSELLEVLRQYKSPGYKGVFDVDIEFLKRVLLEKIESEKTDAGESKN